MTNLFGFEWELTKSPAGAHQWKPSGGQAAAMVPDAHDPSLRHPPMMTTADLALKADPAYAAIARRFRDDPAAFSDAFARAWFKLTHRDMGPIERYLGPEVPSEALLWQDPVPALDHPLVSAADAADLKARILATGLGASDLIAAAWSSASTFRGSDKRGGANGARVRLEPAKHWEAHEPERLARVLAALKSVRDAFNAEQEGGVRISIADTIVLGGAAGLEHAARAGGHDLSVPFRPGRTDATQAMTDVASYAMLEPAADGFRNWRRDRTDVPSSELLVDRANLLTLNAPEMVVLLAGMRVLDANVGGKKEGVFTDRPGALTRDFFVNLLDMATAWRPVDGDDDLYEGRDRQSGELRWSARGVDLLIGSNSQLRAIAEVYGCDDAEEKFARDFIAAWHKVMNLDRFDRP